ncbi:MAG: 4-hydroxy-3-methylbut-2-enyl diphosphate reductase, partial [Candidatus Syntrophonatronum acetioxidans]
MEVRVAEHAGFCAGVKRAIRLALEAASRGEEVYTLGPLVHNRQVVEHLKDKSVKYVEDLGEIDHGTVVFRSHGAGPGVYEKAKEKGLEIVDATCPFVKKVQEKVCSLTEDGYKIIIAGDPNHPEVQGLVDWSRGHALVIEDEEQLGELKWDSKVAVIAQTTVREEFFNRVVERAKAYDPGVAIFRTICRATRLRQKSAVELAGQVDLMLVIGGLNSSNTRKLALACIETGTPTYHIEEAAELKREWLDNIKITGVTAGASTPVWSIKEVIRLMSEFNNEEFKEENVNEEESQEKEEEEVEGSEEEVDEEEGTEEEAQEEAAEEGEVEETEETEEEATAQVEEEEEVTEETYDREITPLEKGEIVKGKVVQVADDELLVDVGYKMDGIVPRSEVDVKSGESLKETFQVDDELDLYVLKVPVSDEDKLL